MEHFFFFDCADGTGSQCYRSGHTKWIASQAKLAEKIPNAEDGSDGGALVFCFEGESHSAFLDIKKSVSGFTLRVDQDLVLELRNFSAETGAGGETIEASRIVFHTQHKPEHSRVQGSE